MDFELLEGMPLADVLRIIAMEEPDIDISVGSASGYVAIDSAAALCSGINKLSSRALESFYQVRKRNYELIVSSVNAAGGCTDSAAIVTYINAMVGAENKLRGFVPFGFRTVKECRRRLLGGVALIVDGDEKGTLWVKGDG